MTGVDERFWNKVNKTDTCWLWTGALQSRGYGSVGIGNHRTGLAHRVAYEALVGPIGDGLTIDHLCRVKSCVNPAHLEPVTSAENIRRHFEYRTTCRHGAAIVYRKNKLHSRDCNACTAAEATATNDLRDLFAEMFS
jgi:hypothetical protein